MHKAAQHRLSNNNMTVLHWASANGHIRVIKGLLGAGAAVDSLDQRGFSPLICACEFGRKNVIEYLIAHAAVLDINLEEEKALAEAARFNHPGVLKILFRHGTKLNHQDWWTILLAASSGHLEVAELLLIFALSLRSTKFRCAHVPTLAGLLYTSQSLTSMLTWLHC